MHHLAVLCGLAHIPHPAQVVDVLPPEADSSIRTMQMTEKPDVTYEVRCGSLWLVTVSRVRPLTYTRAIIASRQDIGGLDIQKQEVREAVELPLTHFELYKQIGIDPPRGVSIARCAHLRCAGPLVLMFVRPRS